MRKYIICKACLEFICVVLFVLVGPVVIWIYNFGRHVLLGGCLGQCVFMLVVEVVVFADGVCMRFILISVISIILRIFLNWMVHLSQVA